MKEIVEQGLAHYKGQHIPLTDYDDAFSPFEIENIPLESQETTLDVSWLSLNGFSVIQRKTKGDILQYGRSLDNALTLFMPSEESCSVNNFVSTAKQNTSSFIVNPGDRDRRVMTGDSRNIVMALEINSLKNLLSQQELNQLLDAGSSIQKAALNLNELQYVSHQFSGLFNKNNQFDDFTIGKNLEHTVFKTLMLLNLSKNKKRQNPPVQQTLNKAIDYIKHKYMQQVTVGEIAEHSHTSVRNLQYIFKAKLGMTPLAFMRCYRLYKFHGLLGQFYTIKEAALNCGFMHIGRTTQIYKNTYGITPSQQLLLGEKSNFFGWLSHHPVKRYIA